MADLRDFSARRYIVNYGLIGDDAVADPIVREFMKFQYLSGLDAWADAVKRCKNLARKQQRALPCGGNQINAWGTWPYAVAISQFCDFVEIEELVGVKEKMNRRTLQYKVGLASGHHAKPVWVRGPVTDETREKSPMLSTSWWTVHFAEALANGGIREFSLGVNKPWTGEEATKDYLDDPQLYQLYIDFAAWMRAHRAQLTHRKSAASVALVYSLPSLMFRRYDALHTEDGDRLGRFERTAKLLEENHIPYDVIVFGHPELWDDEPTFERLKEQYQLVILPGVDAMTDDQVQALLDVAAKGTIVLADEAVSRDENLNARPSPASLVTLDRSEDNILRYGAEASGLEINAPPEVAVNT